MFRSMILLFVTCFLLTDTSYSQPNSLSIPTLSYGELIAKQDEYIGKQLRVFGYWFIFFEASALHSPTDPQRKNAAWVDFGDPCKESDGKLNSIGKDFIGDVSVVFVGKLETGRRYGHMGGYKYRFVVDCVEQIKKLPNAKNLCNQLVKIKKLPYRDPADTDPIYEALIAKGADAYSCLIEKITDTKKMKDPREAPMWSHYTVGDTAVFVLVRSVSNGDEKIEERLLKEMLPPKYREEWKTNGVYAYFNYVSESKNRNELQRWWRNWLKEKTKNE